MKLKSINKLSALICLIYGLTLPAFAKTLVVDGNDYPPESNETYEATSTQSALTVTNNGSYTGVANINLESTFDSIAAVDVNAESRLTLAESAITTTGSRAYGIHLANSSGTFSNVNIGTKGEDAGGLLAQESTLTLTGGAITIDVGGFAYGIGLFDSTGTVRGVNIETTGYADSAVIAVSSTLTLTNSDLSVGNSSGNGLDFMDSTVIASNVNIKTTGYYSRALAVLDSSTLALTDSDISATGDGANALYIDYNSSGTVSLNHNTLTGGILVTGSSTLDLTGSNGAVITGNIEAEADFYDENVAGSTINITLSGQGTQLIGNLTQDETSAITLDISDGAALIGSGTVSNLTLGDDAILGYTDNGPLVINGAITIGENILIDFSSLTETGDYTLLDWSGAAVSGDITADKFNIAGTEVKGTFTVDGAQLTFNATAIPEPSIYILLGIGIGVLLLTARRRSNQS
jgi:hypothetical protein